MMLVPLRRLLFAADQQPAMFTMIYDGLEAADEAVHRVNNRASSS